MAKCNNSRSWTYTGLIYDIRALWRSALSARVLEKVDESWMAKYNQLTRLPFKAY